MFKAARHQDFTESPVPYRVLRTVRRVTVTSLTEPVWVVKLDIKVYDVRKVRTYQRLTNIPLKIHFSIRIRIKIMFVSKTHDSRTDCTNICVSITEACTTHDESDVFFFLLNFNYSELSRKSFKPFSR